MPVYDCLWFLACRIADLGRNLLRYAARCMARRSVTPLSTCDAVLDNGRRIALYLADLTGGGAERMAINLAQGFAERDIEVDLVLASATGAYLNEIPDSVDVFDLATGSVMRSIPRLIRYLRRRRPDALVVTLRHSSIAVLLARRLAGVHTRVFVREASSLTPAPGGGARGRVLPFLIRHVYPWADGVIAVSDAVAEAVVRFTRVPADKVHTLYNPVVTSDLLDRSREAVDHPWFDAKSKPLILAAGRLHAAKDFAALIRAFAQVREKRDARLVILGEGRQRQELETLVAQLDLTREVSLPGFVDNPFAYMARASVFVLSSRWEGLPGVLIQAMACGCPVVSTDCPGGSREILDDGRYGALIPVGDDAALADAICATLDSPLPPNTLQARAAAFSLDKVMPQYMELLFPSASSRDAPTR